MLDKKKSQVQRSRAVNTEINPPHIDWRLVLDDLGRAGCTGYRVASELGASWSTVQNWRKPNSEPGYGYGRALLRLHSRYCGAGLTFLRHTQAEQ